MGQSEPDPGVAVVTGGADGIGAMMVRRLLRSGHDVAVLDLDCPDGAADTAEEGRRTVYTRGSVTDPAAVVGFAAGVRAELGPARVLVNNVGASPYRSFSEETTAGLREVLEVNVASAFAVTKAFLDDLSDVPDARVVNMSSSVVWDAESRNMVAYATAKAGIVGLTRALATELGARDITVNCIAPGIVRTPDTADRVSEEKLAVHRQRQAVPRIAEPESLGSSLDYLVSRESGHVTGLVLGVNGGRVWV
jgi:3-oxoacyl-[acyl-carrier protein] reductase/(S)-1-phenylethanol dehydrogenase